MSSNGMYLHLVATITATLLAATLVGCQTTPEATEPAAVVPPDQDEVVATREQHGSPIDVPDGLNMFGDRPDEERVPFENRLITNLRRHTTTTEGLDFDPDIYDAENLLVFASTRISEHPDIFLKTVDGATLTQLTSDPADDIQPRFSPDGERIVFCSNRAGSWDIWMVKRDGTELTQLTHDTTDEVAPCWSPDGSQVAYTVWGHRSRQWEMWLLSTTQPGVRHFLAYGMFPDWSPDGSQLAFQRARQRGSHLFSVWTVALVAGEARHPTEIAHNDGAACIAPRWSPDGTMIVYCVVNGGGPAGGDHSVSPSAADVWVVDVSSGLRMKLTDGAAPAFNPVWAEGGRVFFVSPQAGTENVWSLTTKLTDYAAQSARGPTARRASGVISKETTKD